MLQPAIDRVDLAVRFLTGGRAPALPAGSSSAPCRHRRGPVARGRPYARCHARSRSVIMVDLDHADSGLEVLEPVHRGDQMGPAHQLDGCTMVRVDHMFAHFIRRFVTCDDHRADDGRPRTAPCAIMSEGPDLVTVVAIDVMAASGWLRRKAFSRDSAWGCASAVTHRTAPARCRVSPLTSRRPTQ